jgi:hypothetical protein
MSAGPIEAPKIVTEIVTKIVAKGGRRDAVMRGAKIEKR